MEDYARKVVNSMGTTSRDAVALSHAGAAVMVTRPSFKFTLNEPPAKPHVPKEPYCNPASREARWQAHLVKNAGKKPQHKLYQSSSKQIAKKYTDADLQRPPDNIRDSKFSEWVARGHMRSKNTSLNTGLYKSRFHKVHDGLI